MDTMGRKKMMRQLEDEGTAFAQLLIVFFTNYAHRGQWNGKKYEKDCHFINFAS